MTKHTPNLKAHKIAGGVHTDQRHDSAHKHVSGAAVYIDDMPEPAGTLHVGLGLSTVARGTIKSLDLSAVRAAPGVVGVLTHEDVPGENDVSPSGMHDDPILAEGKVEFHGQPVFAVVARTREAARRAARLAKIQYEERPPVLDIALLDPEKDRQVTTPLTLTRGDAAKFSGGYHRIVEGINNTLDVVITPINETIAVMKRMADGDLTVDMSGEYKGDFDILKTALNGSVGSINDILDQVNTAVEQVAAGSLQVSQASQALSQGATEQASSLEEITSSITEVSGQTKQNTENAIQVNGLARSAKESAEQGNRQMQDLVAAMNDINVSAEEIRKIVKAIDDISFQINLLALNANVEAARAGKYGKGFAVVAEEVRNLAVRSADSVKETTRMVDEAIANIERGNGLVDVTAKQLAAIVDGAAKVADLAEEVSAASKEQTQGLEQITLGLNQIDQVTQANTASAEESAAAAEELSSQAQQLKGTVARFKLKEREVRVSNSDILQLLRAELARQQGPQGHGLASLASLAARDSFPQPAGKPAQPRKAAAPRLNPADVISLDDDNFGKF